MSKIEHTPEPWEFGKDRRWLFRDDFKADGNFSSTTILKIDDDAFRPSEANARLIAAAPELLEAAKCALGHLTGNMDGDMDLGDPLEMLRAAIAKAEGRT